MHIRVFRKIGKFIKYAIISLVIFIFLFSDLISFLPLFFQNNKLAENFKVNQARAAVGDGIFIYDQTTPTTNVQSRAWTDSTNTVGPATSPFAGIGTSKHIYVKGSQTRQEILLGIQNSAGLLTVYMSTDNGASWVSQWTATVGDGNLKRFEIAYEQNSGDALVLYSANIGTTNEIKYQTWNGVVWSGALNFDTVRTSGTVYGIRAAERSGSDEIGIVWVDTNLDISANLWTGTAWYGEPAAALSTSISRSGGTTPSAVPTRRGYDLAFESLSGDLMVAWGDDSGSTTQIDPKYVIKPAGGAWGAAVSITNLTEDGEMIDIAPSPISDKIAFSTCSIDTGADCNAIVWSGAAWGAVSSDTSSAAAIIGESSNNVEWLVDGANEVAIMTYSDAAGGGIDWRTAANGTTIVAQADNTAAPAIAGLERAGFSKVNPGDSREAIFIFEDANADIFVKIAYLTGTTVAWSNPAGLSTAIETNASVTGFNPVGFAFQKFAPAPLGPDALSFTNDTEGALLDGGRSGQQITVAGTNFGTVADGNQSNCSGGPPTGCVRFIIGGNAIVADIDVTAWSDISITFTIDANLASYGGLASLQVVRAGNADTTSLDFYIYPNITSAPASGQIGYIIPTISGDHFGSAQGTIKINGATVTSGAWNDTSITNVKVPGQTGIVSGQIEVIRDASIDNKNASSNFTTLSPSISGSSPASASTGQVNFLIEFSGQGIDTDIGISPVLKLTKGQPANCTASPTCIIGTSYAKVTDYQTISATFDLSGAATGYWKLVIVNMDGLSGTFGDEAVTGFNITTPAPVVTGIDPLYGNNYETVNINWVSGLNFQDGAIVQLTKTAQLPIDPMTAFTYNVGTGRLENGVFDFTIGKTIGLWKVVVTQGSQSGSFGDEINDGFEIRSPLPSNPSSLIQSKTQGGASVGVGEGIGGQTAIWFGMEMSGGKTGEPYYPQVEVQPNGAAFECDNNSLDACVSSPAGFFAEGLGVAFNGTPVQGWVSASGVDGTSYHWQARVRNSAGRSNWVSFGGNTDPNDIDVYIDDTPPVISMGTDGTCATAAPLANITDLSAIIQWNTFDNTSGAQSGFPNSGTWAKAQVDYKKGLESWTATPLSLWENSLHQVAVSGLSPATTYTFRMRSQDYVGNETISGDCAFTTTSSRPIKTVEFFIVQETARNLGILISKDFSVYLPESFGEALSVKSAFIEITGISDTGAQSVNVELRRGLGAVFTGTGTAYDVDSTGTTTPFVILFDALNSNEAEGNQKMSNIVTGSPPAYDYTLFLNGNGVAISAFSAKLIITYSYAQ